jgi:hypothetical protein
MKLRREVQAILVALIFILGNAIIIGTRMYFVAVINGYDSINYHFLFTIFLGIVLACIHYYKHPEGEEIVESKE